MFEEIEIKEGEHFIAKVHRKNLWLKSPLCCYCHQPTVLPEDCLSNGQKKPPDNMATVEHVFTRFDKERWVKNNRHIIALACHKCNNLMGSIRQAFVPIEELRERSQQHERAKARRKAMKAKKLAKEKVLKDLSLENIIEILTDDLKQNENHSV
jgi:hypothetical protein